MQEEVMWREPFQKQAPVCCRVVRPLPRLFWFPLPGLPGYREVLHVPGKASGASWNIYPRREETWGKLHRKLKGPNKERGRGTAGMTNIVTKQNFFQTMRSGLSYETVAQTFPAEIIRAQRKKIWWVKFSFELQEKNRALSVVKLNV